MFLKIVRNDYSNKYHNTIYEPGKSYNHTVYFFRAKKSKDILNIIREYFVQENEDEFRVLVVDPLEEPFQTDYGDWVCNKVKIVEEYPKNKKFDEEFFQNYLHKSRQKSNNYEI